MDKCCAKALVTGKVQGVWYRGATRERALRAGITGHAINLPDGRVEVLMCGEREAVKRLAEWLWEGPENARVTHVEFEVIDTHEPDDFRTG
ncbi:acylphosphatase [Halomonas lysinitropha]|uniref:acylphosphatase n=1 Tax=Halomonas lysinitropha TaxID=2607506 RepID=A0A5K1I6M9_9GAMM|nr:acylphosphatase [Halomonas lysinitropha]VVZ97274.1 Acylphosphatase [Halomonas lysinitropha]